MAVSLTNGVAACAAAAAVVCGGTLIASNSGSGAVSLMASAPASATLAYPDAIRLSQQAAFGPTLDLVAHMTQTDIGSWLDEQFAATGSTYTDLAAPRAVPRNYCRVAPGNLLPGCTRDYKTATPVQIRFYADAVGQPDQLRQRVAFALSQLMVASDITVPSTAGMATLNQIFLDNAFGNYRDILKAVTLSAAMGDFLNLADSNKIAPSENYAREFMQLFSMGVNQLNPDGTLKRDASGAPIANYGSADVHDVARALTGWTFARLAGAGTNNANAIDYSKPLIPIPANYDTGAKSFLGRTVPAGASQAASLDAVIDAGFNQASTAPYVANFLIQQLVVSNPSAAFVGRVAAVFADNGSGVRGDMKAVVRAILTDPEARTAPNAATQGKVKEPVLFAVSLARAVGMATDGYVFTVRDGGLGEEPFRAPSVFNFYPPSYPLPLGAPLLSPPSKLMTTATVVARHNLAYDWTIGADAARNEFAPLSGLAGATGTQVQWSTWEAFGSNVDGQLDRINLMMLGSSLTATQRASIKAAMLAVTNTDPALQARRRAETALYIAAASPLFQIDR